MTAPEVTREEAARRLLDLGQSQFHPLARTVVALYDRMAALVESTLPILQNEAEAIPRERAMRECINRLRDGWDADEFTERQGTPTGWCWYRFDPDPSGGGEALRVPMTPEQQAVMAR